MANWVDLKSMFSVLYYWGTHFETRPGYRISCISFNFMLPCIIQW